MEIWCVSYEIYSIVEVTGYWIGEWGEINVSYLVNITMPM